MRGPVWIRLLFVLGALKLAGTLAALYLADVPMPRTGGGPYEVPPVLDVAYILVFGAVAAFLYAAGRNDRRALSLAGFFLSVAAAFCMRPLVHITGLPRGPLGVFGVALDSLKLDAFLPFFLWRFVQDFPRIAEPPRLKTVFRLGVITSAAAGVAFLLLNFVRTLLAAAQGPAAVPAGLAVFAPKTGAGLYHGLLMGLTALAFPLLIWKARSAQGEERRRVLLFTAGLVLGLGPALLEVLCELAVPGYFAWMSSRRDVSSPMAVTLGLFAMSVPVTTAYAVVMHRVLDVKLIARRAVRYALARSSVLVLVAVPLLSLAVYLVMHRTLTINELFSGPRMPLLLAAVAVSFTALRYRRPLLDAIDRRFFREQYDARQILTLLVERIRSISEAESLASLVSREIDLALHLEGISMMVLDPRSGMLTDPKSRARRLDASSLLALRISNASDPLQVDFEDPASPLARLPEKERHWLVDSGFRLIVPILARDGSLLGCVGLGEKKSGLPFLREDRQLLHAIASSAAWVLELDLNRSLTPQRSWLDQPDIENSPRSELPIPSAELAKECGHCGALFAAYTVFCSHCSRKLEVARVPYVLPGKFRFEKRIGVGGMGIVYRGSDLALGRHVAIKTLRRVSPEDAMRLRREARTAATVSHPHLAPIFGLETWQGTPMLVMELLEGGTLAQLIADRPLSPRETVDLGISVAEALGQLHAADILHRDVKPTNIGYTRDRVPKLMDFGIARIMQDLDRDSSDLVLVSGGQDDTEATRWGDHSRTASMLSARQLVGTLGYLSPEAAAGQTADASFDLWSLGIVLYECLLGRKVFSGDAQQIMARIKLGRVPEFSQILPELEDVLGDFFRAALHKTRSRRPATAQDFRQRLLAARARL